MIKLKVSEEELLWWYVNNRISLSHKRLRMFLEKNWKSFIEYDCSNDIEIDMFKEYFEEVIDYSKYIGKLCVFSNTKISNTSSVDIGILNSIEDNDKTFISNDLKRYNYCMLSTEYELLLNNSKICNKTNWLKDALLEVKEQIKNEPNLFGMCNWTNKRSCGTIHCIGGWLQEVTNNRIVVNSNKLNYTVGNMPDVDGCNNDNYSSLFNAHDWESFIRYETEEFICNYCDDFNDFDNDEFDELEDDVKIKIACMVIDDYITEYL